MPVQAALVYKAVYRVQVHTMQVVAVVLAINMQTVL
jgi:hypothetical protein